MLLAYYHERALQIHDIVLGSITAGDAHRVGTIC